MLCLQLFLVLTALVAASASAWAADDLEEVTATGKALLSLPDHKKDALVSLFVSYTQGGNPGMLNDRFGAPQESYGRAANEGQVMAGIRLKF